MPVGLLTDLAPPETQRFLSKLLLTFSRSTDRLPPLVVNLKISSSAASTQVPSMSQISPCSTKETKQWQTYSNRALKEGSTMTNQSINEQALIAKRAVLPGPGVWSWSCAHACLQPTLATAFQECSSNTGALSLNACQQVAVSTKRYEDRRSI